MTTAAAPDAGARSIDVAAEVRAELARTRVRPNHLPSLLGKSQSYWSRRVNGVTPFDTQDLLALAALLHVHPARFFGVDGLPPQTDPAGPLAQLAELRTFNPYGAVRRAASVVVDLAAFRKRVA